MQDQNTDTESTEFIHEIIESVLLEVLQTDEEVIQQRINAKSGSEDVCQGGSNNQQVNTYDFLNTNSSLLQTINEEVFVTKLHTQKMFPKINQLEVVQQQGGMLCGFHCFWNARCFLESIFSETGFERATHLSNLSRPSKFQKNYLDTLDQIMKCDNVFYINKTNKKQLQQLKGPMERNMLRYLLFFDPDIQRLKRNQQKVPVYMKIFGMQFGQVQMTHQHIKEFQDDLKEFHQAEGEAVFVIFIAALNHWVTFIAHKTIDSNQAPKTNLYYMDSMNFDHLNHPDEEIPVIFNSRIVQRMKNGPSNINSFTVKMCIHSIYDVRRSLCILQDVFLNKTPVVHYFTQSHLHTKLRFFNMAIVPIQLLVHEQFNKEEGQECEEWNFLDSRPVGQVDHTLKKSNLIQEKISQKWQEVFKVIEEEEPEILQQKRDLVSKFEALDIAAGDQKYTMLKFQPNRDRNAIKENLEEQKQISDEDQIKLQKAEQLQNQKYAQALKDKEEKWLMHPSWELYDTWLIFYHTLPVEIPSYDRNMQQQNQSIRPRAYHYLENLDILPTADANNQAYRCIIDMFLKMGHRIVDIHYDTLNNIYEFGAQHAFFEEDRLLLMDWCQAIIQIQNRYQLSRQKGGAKAKRFTAHGVEIKNDEEDKDENLFEQLVQLCKKVFKKLDPRTFKDFEDYQALEKDVWERKSQIDFDKIQLDLTK